MTAALPARLLAEDAEVLRDVLGDHPLPQRQRAAIERAIEAAAALSGRKAVAADWKMEVKPSASDAEILTYLDELLDVQGRLMFAKGNAPEPLGEVFGVAILDFMRLHGMRVREIIRAYTTPQPGDGWVPLRAVLNFVDCLAIDGKGLRHEYVESRSGSMVRIPNFHESAAAPSAKGG